MFFRPQEIDEAARRRLVKRLYIPLPDTSARRQIVTNLMKEQPFFLSDEEMEDICLKSGGKLLVFDINSSVYHCVWVEGILVFIKKFDIHSNTVM